MSISNQSAQLAEDEDLESFLLSHSPRFLKLLDRAADNFKSRFFSVSGLALQPASSCQELNSGLRIS